MLPAQGQIVENLVNPWFADVMADAGLGRIFKNILWPFKPFAHNGRQRDKQWINNCMQPTFASTPAPDEANLIGAAQRGDLTAYRKLYDIHVGMVYGLATRLVKDRSAAEYVTQEVFIKVWKDIGKFRGDSKFSTWLHRICTLTAITYLRRQRNWLKRVVTGDESIPEIATASQGNVDLGSYVSRLPERARIVFVLHAIEGYMHEEIASMCDMAVGSSKAQFHRAKQLLEEWMNHE